MEAVYTKNRIKDRFIQNHTGFWYEHRWILAVFITAVFCDALSTIMFMNRLGIEAELHPIYYLVSKVFGPNIGPLLGAVGKTGAAIAVGIYCRKFAPYLFLAITIISFWAAWYNVWGINIYVP